MIDRSGLDPRFTPYYESGQRIRVTTHGETITGTVGKTMGWKPSYMLMRTPNARSSSWLLGPADRIEAVKVGDRYQTIRFR